MHREPGTAVDASLGFAASLIACGALVAAVLADGSQTKNRLVTSTSMGPVRLGMTLAEARASVPAASFKRSSDGDGAALVEITFGDEDHLVLWAEEEDPDLPIDGTRRIVTMFTFSRTFRTAEGVGPGDLVTDVIATYGPVREIERSEIESREFIAFARQPSWLTVRLDYTGVFPDGVRHTREFRPGARILALGISSLSAP